MNPDLMMEYAQRQAAARVSGVPNVTYDLIAVLHSKLSGIAALEVYRRDAREAGHSEAEAFFAQCEQQDRDAVEQLRGLLAGALRGGAWARSGS